MQQLSHVKGRMFDGTDMKAQLSKYDSENFRKTKNTVKLGAWGKPMTQIYKR